MTKKPGQGQYVDFVTGGTEAQDEDLGCIKVHQPETFSGIIHHYTPSAMGVDRGGKW